MTAQQLGQQLLRSQLPGVVGTEKTENLAPSDSEIHATNRRCNGLRIRESRLADLDNRSYTNSAMCLSDSAYTHPRRARA